MMKGFCDNAITFYNRIDEYNQVVTVKNLGHMAPDWMPGTDEFEILLLHYQPNNWWHFVTGDGKGNVAYDPWGSAGPGFRGSGTVALGELENLSRSATAKRPGIGRFDEITTRIVERAMLTVPTVDI